MHKQINKCSFVFVNKNTENVPSLFGIEADLSGFRGFEIINVLVLL